MHHVTFPTQPPKLPHTRPTIMACDTHITEASLQVAELLLDTCVLKTETVAKSHPLGSMYFLIHNACLS